MKVRFITPYYGAKGQRLLTLPALAAEFLPHCDVELCDQNVEPIDESDCDMVGISLLVYNAPIGYRIAANFRERGIPVIMGGSWPSVSPHLVAPHCDAVVVGEVEGLGQRIIDDLKRGRLQKIYRNSTPPALGTLRLPRVDLLKNNRYFQLTGYPMELTRGCPNSCTFCVSTQIQPGFRKKPYWMVIRDLEARDGPILNLYDLNIGADREYLSTIARIFAEFPIMAWQCQTCIGHLDDEPLLKLLQRSNLNQVYVGIESISERTLTSVNKQFNPVKRYRQIIQKCHDHGIHIAAGFIVGLDGEDKSVFERTLEFFDDVRMEYATPLYVTYLPGTPMHDKLKREGRILSDNLADYDGLHPTVKPDGMTVDELQEGVEWFVKNFYGPRSIAVRALQRANRHPVDLLGYLSFNWWFGSMYRSLYERDESGRCPAFDRQRYDELTLHPIDRERFGPGLGEDVMTVLNRIDRGLRPLQRLYQSIRFSPDSVSRRCRHPGL